jgi:hypothetical protein
VARVEILVPSHFSGTSEKIHTSEAPVPHTALAYVDDDSQFVTRLHLVPSQRTTGTPAVLASVAQ